MKKEEGTPFIPRMNDGGFQAILGVICGTGHGSLDFLIRRSIYRGRSKPGVLSALVWNGPYKWTCKPALRQYSERYAGKP